MGSIAVVQLVTPRAHRLVSAKTPSRARGVGALSLFLVLCLLIGTTWFLLPSSSRPPVGLLTHRVQYQTLHFALSTHGTFDSAQARDIVCQVKARTRGNTLATTIKWIIDDGEVVHQGDRLVELNASGIEEDLETNRIALLKAQSDWEQAEENAKIVVSQNRMDVEIAGMALTLAEIDLEKYVKGNYQQAHQDVASRLSQAESDYAQSQDHVAWSERMLKKGFLSSNQAQTDEAREQSAEVVLQNVQQAMRVLERYTHKAMLFDLQSKAAGARRTLERIKAQALCKQLQGRIDCLTKRAIYEYRRRAVRDLEDQIRYCTITAPQDGTVVYVSQQSRYGRGSQQCIVAQGEPVREGQALLEIADLTRMTAEILIPEFSLGHVRPGTEVLLRPHAFPEEVLHGHIKHISNFISQYEWLLTDAHLYRADVTPDESMPGLRAGMTADASVLLDQPHEHVLAVPIEALADPIRCGETNSCLVQTAHGTEAREVVVGLSNDTLAEIQSGLSEGEEVVLNRATTPADCATAD
jgi:HlyD family secretion protein